MYDKQEINLKNYENFLKDKDKDKKLIEKKQQEYKDRQEFNQRVEKERKRVKEKTKKEREERLNKLIEYFENLTSIEQEQLFKKLKL